MTETFDALRSALADRYRLERKLGAGGMATVYLALDLRHDRRVAVKVLNPHVASVLGGERFLREIRIAARLTHPHIVPLLDSGSAAGFLYYVMPHIDGETLRERIARDGDFAAPEASRILRDMADALAKAHSLDIVHRDIKPENVMLADRHALVMDFGVAKAVRMASDNDQLTTAGVTLGTPAYMAPEQAAGDPNVDHRADIYALGVVGYEMLCGAPPFVRATPAEVLAAHVTATPTPIEERQPTVAPELAALVMRCLEKRPADRPQTAEVLAHRLEQAATPSVGTTPIRVLGPGRRPRFSPKAIALAALVVLAIVVAAIVFRPTVPSEPADAIMTPVICETCVAVFPFTLTGHDSLAMWETGAALLLGQDLDGAAQIRTVDHNAIVGAAERLNAPVDPVAADQMTRDLWGSWYVLGSLLGLGDRNRLTGTLYHIDDPTPVASAVAEGTTAEMPRLVKDLAAEFTLHLPLGEGPRLANQQRIRTDNYEALKAYLQGEQHFRRKEVGPAGDAFARAIELDSMFGLPRYRRVVTQTWGSITAGRIAAEEAYPYRGQLTGVDSLLLEGLHAYLTGDAEGAERTTSRLVSEYPSNAEAWFLSGANQLWYGWQLGQSPSLTRAPIERALELDPDHTQSQFYLAWVAGWEGNNEEWEATRVNPYAQSRAWDMAFAVTSAFEHDDASAQDSLLAQLDSEGPFLINFIATFANTGWLQNLTITTRLSELLTNSSRRSLEAQLLGWLNLARVEVARGRWRQAAERLDSVEAIAPALGLVYRGWLAATPFLSIDSDELTLIRDAVTSWDGQLDAGLDLSWRAFNPYHIPSDIEPHLRPYLVGLLSARLGDYDSAKRSAEALYAAITPSDTLDLVHDLAVEVDAFAKMSSGDLDSALILLETSKLTIWPSLAIRATLYMRPLSRLFRAEILYEQGALEEAAGWYSTFAHFAASHWSLNPWSHYRRGQIYDELGDEEQAVRNYAKFVEQWADAAPELQEYVEYARQRLEALAPDRAR